MKVSLLEYVYAIDMAPPVPFEVLEEDLVDLDFYGWNTITYYKGDGFFIDDEDEIMGDVKSMIGESVFQRLPRELKDTVYVYSDNYYRPICILVMDGVSPYTESNVLPH